MTCSSVQAHCVSLVSQRWLPVWSDGHNCAFHAGSGRLVHAGLNGSGVTAESTAAAPEAYAHGQCFVLQAPSVQIAQATPGCAFTTTGTVALTDIALAACPVP